MRQPELKTLSLDRFIEFLGDTDTLPVQRAYDDVGWFRRGIDIRTSATRDYPFDLIRGEEALATEAPETHTELDPVLNIFYLLDEMSADLDMFGCFYAIFETNRFNRNGKWRRLYPKSIEPQYDKATGEITAFKRRVNNQHIMLDPDDILHIFMPNRSAEVGHGHGVGYSALRAATTLDNITKFQGAFFENGALSPTIVTIDGYHTLSQDEQGRVKSVFQRMMQGVKNAFKIIPVSGNTTVSTLMQPLNEMSMDVLTNQQREDVSTALGVPHSLLFPNAANFATASQDTLNFYDLSITPHVRMIQQQLNERLYAPLGYRLSFMPERLEVYQQLESQKADKLAMLFDRNVITLGEFREQMGLPPIEEVDSYEEESPQNDMDERIQRLEGEDVEQGGKVATPTGEVFGYHIDSGVVTINEARTQLGLPPKPEPEIDALQDLQSKLSVMSTATGAGVPPDIAASLVGLDIQIAPRPNTFALPNNNDESEQEQDEAPPVRSALIGDLDKWKLKAFKRYDEGTPHKALEFTSDAIPPTLHSIIINSLQIADSKATVGAIFNDATLWETHA